MQISNEETFAFKKMVFVSRENTFTSCVAEVIAKNLLRDNEIEIESRGIVVLFPEPANAKGATIAKARGLNMGGHIARPVDENIFGADILVIAMTEKIKEAIYEKWSNAVNVFTLGELAQDEGDIVTPYGKSLGEYELVYNRIENAVKRIALKIKKEGDV